ncbi:AAA family ATPase [Bradyrhizobium diazoefficiens]|jgi:succinoglycan biosynthesis transport protein ExoP|nr:AAA family ATPase [Bradyrhizobium diazoefficiens]MBR0963756.1 AAA family ATPase [Bradyrhizobium diazoefficiens]MBR0977908.1 AAA family ATPase [Bradyrhizobium diazoefficiens]MBR1007418.1 AAA family ATPase [Bradyrhizobium diazoefficiens]MBR1012741.1 AAA family ATPase [Bradyrhizobium diazoefficiens]MBR1052289.1 AAA family ATPase [Bradyrhizobium diazoefficiens]
MNLAGQFSNYTPAVDNGPPAEQFPLRHIWEFLKRQWRLIALVTCLAITLDVVYLAVTPSRYTAQADLIIDTKRVSWTQSELATENRTIEDASVESEIETTKSEKVALAVVQRLHLDEDAEFVGAGSNLKSRILSLLKLSPGAGAVASKEDLTRRALGTLKDNLRVMRLGRSYIEQIAYTSLDPAKAATIANVVAEAYIEDQLQAKFDATHRASIWLEQRIGELRQQASDAYKAVQDFKSQNGIIIGVEGKLASEVELDQLGVALAKARADTSQAKARLDRIERVLEHRTDKGSFDIPDPIVTDALNNPVITKLRQQFLDDQSKESEWSARYGADHQAARNLRAEMAALQRAIWDEISRIAESYKSELQIAKSQEESIDKRMSEVFQLSASTRQSQVRLRELETAANTYRGIYETFLSRFTQSVQQQSFPSTEARIITAATPPRGRSSPKISLTLALATVCGLGLGLLSAFAREQMNRQIHTRAQLEALLGTTCLAVLPAFQDKNSAVRKQGGRRESAAFMQLNDAPPFSATAEALRYIKVAIDLHPSGGKVIGFVSALPSEGKTTVAAGFAAFVAKSGARTLLIDGDLRNPSMTSTLGYDNSPGLLDMVADKSQFDEIVITDSKYKFDFLPASTRIKPSNSSDILNSAITRRTLKAAKMDYDYVLVDLPPILPVVDVKAVAHLFDAFVLVVEWGSTSTEEILKAVAASPLLSERLLGAVLNKADEAVMRRFEGYSDRSYNSYYTNDTIAEKV